MTDETPLTRLPGRWFELRVTVPRASEDAAAARMQDEGSLGARAAAAGPSRVLLTTWFASREAAERALLATLAFDEARLAPPGIVAITDPGWLESARPREACLRAGRFLVAESGEPGAAETGRHEGSDSVRIVLRRGRAFGTGEHPTTRLCLEALSTVPRGPGRVLDLGTGSGILGIAAALDGRGPVFALDNDEAVLEVAEENARANGVLGDVVVRRGSWTDLADDGPFSLVLANIHRTTLCRAAAACVRSMLPGAHAVLSGFPGEDVPLVARAWEAAGARRVGQLDEGEWAALVVALPG